ncbi:hypothetical protein LWI29_029795 [Acer saccharum]|uniref:Splicing factor Cactin C-terminal domain-containing protein n=1 Tax=Acer saccharum TaxID=4024 RepID=A0AA39VGU5_ACESA|nr:hypothetical protein LWI29_029795 [Acer saccharum]
MGLHSSIEEDVMRLLQGKTHKEEEEKAGESFSPQLLHGDENEEEAIDPGEDRAILERKRMVLSEEQQRRAPSEDMGAMNLDSQVYWWHEKYRPRKPKYFNQVHIGYRWNKYNQTHYDHNDKLPPKIVQGYKLNIFYPDLVDKTKAPTYAIDKDDRSIGGQTCIIRFHAGTPYEDIAFRIVNKEWECSHKKGFKSTFEGGILHLHFNFKRYPYCR